MGALMDVYKSLAFPGANKLMKKTPHFEVTKLGDSLIQCGRRTVTVVLVHVVSCTCVVLALPVSAGLKVSACNEIVQSKSDSSGLCPGFRRGLAVSLIEPMC